MDYYLVIVGDANKTSIEHPVRSPRQRKTITNCVRSAMFDRPNMRRFCFQPTSAVDEPPTSDRTASIVSFENSPPEGSVPKRAVYKCLNQGALNLEWCLLLTQSIQWFKVANARQHMIVRQAKLYNACEVGIRERTHSGLSAARDFSDIIEQPTFNRLIVDTKSHLVREVEICFWLD